MNLYLTKVISIMVLLFLFGDFFKSYGQDDFSIQPLSNAEMEQLRTTDGCGCYLNDLNHCNDKFYLFGDADLAGRSDYWKVVPYMYLKINGVINKFSYKAGQYSLRFTGEPAPVFDLYFDNSPNETDIKNAILKYTREEKWDNVTVSKDQEKKNGWNIYDSKDGYVRRVEHHTIDEYYLFTSEKYIIRLYEYKRGVDIESQYTRGEVFLYKKGENYAKKSIFFIQNCGC